MNARFIDSVNFVLAHECVYAPGHYGDLAYVVTEDVPGDSGGLTKWGIDQASHQGVDIAALTRDDACRIYRAGDWNAVKGDLLPAGWDTAAFDCCVNMGKGVAIQLLQGTLIAFGQSIGEVDGILDDKTLAALDFLGARPDPLRTYLLKRTDHYRQIALNGSRKKFLAGWLNRVNDLAAFLKISNWEDVKP
jgi:lysozyme family protein